MENEIYGKDAFMDQFSPQSLARDQGFWCWEDDGKSKLGHPSPAGVVTFSISEGVIVDKLCT